MLLGGEEFYASGEETFNMKEMIMTRGEAAKNKNKRRFSDEQIRSLESMFENETRLEPRKKVELAKELGLQPRQVAIWFQNKRARWKSKQLERDYGILRSNYNSLASRFEALKKEKQALSAQLQRLRGEEEGKCCPEQVLAANSCEGESENGETPVYEGEVKPSLSVERSEHGLGVLSDEDSSIKTEYFGLEEEPNLVSVADGSLTTSQEDWGSLESDGLFDQSSGGYQWWDFWA